MFEEKKSAHTHTPRREVPARRLSGIEVGEQRILVVGALREVRPRHAQHELGERRLERPPRQPVGDVYKQKGRELPMARRFGLL